MALFIFDDTADGETLPDSSLVDSSVLLNDEKPESEQTESPASGSGSPSRDNYDSGFCEKSPVHSEKSDQPPTAHEIDQWQRHISLQDFAKDLQVAANTVYPNEPLRSRYSRIYVLIFKWEAEDPKLPVSLEIAELQEVLGQIYHYDIEVFEIPEKQSHARVSEKVNTFIAINDDSKDDLKIVYYAGHGRLSKTRDLVWTSFQNHDKKKCSTVTWSGIQKALEQALSDVLILLDCCSSGIGDAGEGNGVTELMSACAFDVIANGVGHYSFTKALTIELRLLSKKKSFPVVELYTHIYCRAQYHMAQGIDNERYPAPIHLLLTRDDNFPRSIQLSIQEPDSTAITNPVPKPSSYERYSAGPINYKRRLSTESLEAPQKRPRLDWRPSQIEADSSITPYSADPESNAGQTSSAADKDSSPDPLQVGLVQTTLEPRLLFAVRLEDNIRAEDLSPEYFADWLRMIPTIAREVRIEAGFECNSTLLLVSMPLWLHPYLSHHPAVISLGPVKSSNLLTLSYRYKKPAIRRDEPKHLPKAFDDETLGLEDSKIYNYPYENGRRYHCFKAGRYMFPNDATEADRLDLQHALFRKTFGNKLYLSPVNKTKQIHRVLDVGTGTGIWAIEFADENPQAEILGIDLSPIQPTYVPPNLTFEIDDLEASWTFQYKFDFIYSRMMTGAFRDWPQFFANSFNNLTPGGFIELADICFPVQAIDDSLRSDSPLRKWCELMVEATRKAGCPVDSARSYQAQLEAAGFINVEKIQYKWPQNRWPKGENYKILGVYNQQNMTDGLEGFSMALFTRILGWSIIEVHLFLVDVRKEMLQKSVHAYWDIYVVYGQKPT